MSLNLKSVARAPTAVLRLVSWRAMPVAVRVIFALLVASTVLMSVQNGLEWVHMSPTLFELFYNGVLIGSALL